MLDERRSMGPFLLVAGIFFTAMLGAAFNDRDVTIDRISGSLPRISSSSSIVPEGAMITVRSTGGGSLLISNGMTRPFERAGAQAELQLTPDVVHASRLISIPLSMQWRPPRAGLPAARVVRASEIDAIGRKGPMATRTFLFQDHAPLPVIALVLHHGALFDADTGIMVVGNAVWRSREKNAPSYHRDARWWKYPGNFMGRGSDWERQAEVEMIDSKGVLTNTMFAKVRIHGQMTRGFPQHALRLMFNDPVTPWASPAGSGDGHHTMVLRAGGNDQVKAMMRDALQQTLCESLPFEVSRAIPCVAYINGAYWGVHHLRERIDHRELARRHGLQGRHITILEDAAVLFRGDHAEVKEFNRLVASVERIGGDDPGHMDRIHSALDVDGFLTYMASQMILGNMDWPEQNVKYWRYTGPPQDKPYADGRWYFIMGDSDLSFGATAPASTDMFIRVRTSNAPVARLFRGLMQDEDLQDLFRDKVHDLLDGPLSTDRMLQGIEAMANTIGPEMDRHTDRWRKPQTRSAWEKEVEVLRMFARAREGHVRLQIDNNGIPGAI